MTQETFDQLKIRLANEEYQRSNHEFDVKTLANEILEIIKKDTYPVIEDALNMVLHDVEASKTFHEEWTKK
jgi:hypothetical protein